MSISFGLGTNLSNSQKLTPQMQQAIRLLQLSSLELEQEVQIKLDSNPLLERVEEDEISADDFANKDLYDERLGAGSERQAEDHYLNDTEVDISGQLEGALGDNLLNRQDDDLSTSQNELSSELSSNLSEGLINTKAEISTRQDDVSDTTDRITENTLGELEVDTDWDDVYTHAPTGLASPDNSEMDAYHGATSANLQDHIRWQLNFKHLSDIDVLIADYLIDSMDDYGFIQIDLDDLVHSFEVMASFYQWDELIERDQVDMVLHVIQSCEPLGVGARNLAECLQIQLKRLPDSTPYKSQALKLLSGHEYLVSNNIKELTQQTGIKKTEIAPALELLRTLNPSPGMAYTNAQPDYGGEPESYDIPDVLVNVIHKDAEAEPSWQVKLNPDTLPKLKINQDYARMVKRGDDSPDNVYLRDNLTDARLFIRSIEERNQNLLKVATCIIQRQQGFLVSGPTAMRPMILKDVADAVELHESTVSRLTTSKSILTPQGLYPLKYFFSSHVSSSDGDVSSTAISAMITELINNEDPKKPLSDSAIKQHLESQGIDIARRTVAKYREAMNIGSSTQRKIKF